MLKQAKRYDAAVDKTYIYCLEEGQSCSTVTVCEEGWMGESCSTRCASVSLKSSYNANKLYELASQYLLEPIHLVDVAYDYAE